MKCKVKQLPKIHYSEINRVPLLSFRQISTTEYWKINGRINEDLLEKIRIIKTNNYAVRK